MATRKHPESKVDLAKAADDTKAIPRASTAAKNEPQKPNVDKEAAPADKARRDAAADAFKHEKAHEPSPKHQA